MLTATPRVAARRVGADPTAGSPSRRSRAREARVDPLTAGRTTPNRVSRRRRLGARRVAALAPHSLPAIRAPVLRRTPRTGTRLDVGQLRTVVRSRARDRRPGAAAGSVCQRPVDGLCVGGALLVSIVATPHRSGDRASEIPTRSRQRIDRQRTVHPQRRSLPSTPPTLPSGSIGERCAQPPARVLGRYWGERYQRGDAARRPWAQPTRRRGCHATCEVLQPTRRRGRRHVARVDPAAGDRPAVADSVMAIAIGSGQVARQPLRHAACSPRDAASAPLCVAGPDRLHVDSRRIPPDLAAFVPESPPSSPPEPRRRPPIDRSDPRVDRTPRQRTPPRNPASGRFSAWQGRPPRRES